MNPLPIPAGGGSVVSKDNSRFLMSKKYFAAAVLALSISTPAVADPAVGLGLNFTFGGGQVNTGVGVRVFSDNEADKLAASVGLDYMITSQSWRGSVGAAYLMDNSYVELNGGYNFNGGGFDFGLGGGWADTADQSSTTDDAPSTGGSGGSTPDDTGGSGGPGGGGCDNPAGCA